ncbi:hypothetical protein CVT24_005445, partial [Panaeolus cyanescens]
MSVAQHTSSDDLQRLFAQTRDMRIKVSSSGLFDKFSYQAPAHCPLWLTDQHLASELALQNVVTVPTMGQDLLESLGAIFTRFLQENEVFPPSNRLPRWMEGDLLDGITDPSSFFRAYQYQIGMHSACFASKLYVHPKEPCWFPTFAHGESSRFRTYYNEVELYIVEDETTFGDMRLGPEVARRLDPAIAEKLLWLRDNYDTLAIFSYVLPRPDCESIFSRPEIEGPSVWTISSTQSPRKLPSRSPKKEVDAIDKWWNKYGSKAPLEKARNIQTAKPTQTGLKNTVWVPPRKGTRQGEYQPNIAHFLQRAWCRAVEYNSTFIVLNDGLSERIGIRHRASNTLFITEPIDPFKAPYMRYHMALYMAIVDDALSRAVVEVAEPDADISPARSRKRRATNVPIATRASKRLKGEAPSANASSVDLYAEIASRHILLVSFDFGIYHSPAPSSFLR